MKLNKYYSAPKGYFKLHVETEYRKEVVLLHEGRVTEETHGTMCVDHCPLKAIRKTLIASRTMLGLTIEDINDVIDGLRLMEFGHVSWYGFGMMLKIDQDGVHKI